MKTMYHLLTVVLSLAIGGIYASAQPARIAKVKKDGKFGYINTSGEEVAPCIYDEIQEFSEGFAKVRMDRKFGFINTHGELVIPCVFDSNLPPDYKSNIDYSQHMWDLPSEYYAGFSEGLAIAAKGGKFGYINTEGEVVIPFVFDKASSFHSSRALVSRGGTQGFIDETGKMVFECNGVEAGDFSNGLAFIREVTKDYGEFGMREYGRRYEYTYKPVTIDGKPFTNSPGKPYEPQLGLYIPDKGPIWIQFKDYNNEIRYSIIEADGDFLHVYSSSYDSHSLLSKDGFIVVEKDGKTGVMDVNRKIIIPLIYDDIPFDSDEPLFHDDLVKVEINGKIGFIDKNQKVVISPKFEWDEIKNFSEGLVPFQNDNNLWGYMDKKGKTVIECKYTLAYEFSEGLAKVAGPIMTEWGESWDYFVIDKTGETVYIGEINDYFSEGLAPVRLGQKYGYIDKSGKIVIPDIYEEATSFICY